MKTAIVIEKLSDIPPLAKDIHLFKVNRQKIEVQLDGLTPDETLWLQQKLNGYYSACGCSQGRVTGIVTFILYSILVATGIISIYKLGIGNTLLLYVGCAFVTMLGGKIYGIRNARKGIQKLTEQLAHMLPTNNQPLK